jgi:hypothetical protein
VTTFDERHQAYVREQSTALWSRAINALNFMRGAASLTGKIGDETMPQRTLLAGTFALLQAVGASNVSDGLRLKLLLEWGPATVTGGKIALYKFIIWFQSPHTTPQVPGLPEMTMEGWAAFASYVKHDHFSGMGDHTLRSEHPEVTMDEWARLATACRELRIVQDVLYQ